MGSRQIEQVTSSHIFSRDIFEVVEYDICRGIWLNLGKAVGVVDGAGLPAVAASGPVRI